LKPYLVQDLILQKSRSLGKQDSITYIDVKVLPVKLNPFKTLKNVSVTDLVNHLVHHLAHAHAQSLDHLGENSEEIG